MLYGKWGIMKLFFLVKQISEKEELERLMGYDAAMDF